MSNRLEELRAAYEAIPIPPQLEENMQATMREHRPKSQVWQTALAAVGCLVLALAVGVNVLPAQAATLEDVPVLGPIVRVLTIANYRADRAGYEANIQVPQVTGLENKELEATINAELRADAQALIAQYEADVAAIEAEMAEMGGGESEGIHQSVETFHEVMASNDEVFSLKVIFLRVAASGAESLEFYNVNQKTGELITLDALFAPGSDYLPVINAHLLEQMRAQKVDGHYLFFVDEFQGIGADHNFYINADGRLVIAFDEYEVAPGAMGAPEFEIPTDLIHDMLASDAPIH